MKSNASDVMTKNPACCSPETSLREVAQMMVAHDCGSIPIVENKDSMKLIGMITDRDIVCRTLARGKNPLELRAADAMSQPVVSARSDSSLGDCCQLMEENQVRRIPIVDEGGRLAGLITQAQIARHARSQDVARVVKDVSRKTREPSRVGASV